MNEKLLHFIWQYKLYSMVSLKTVHGEEMSVIDSGKPNTNAGPDFFNAKVIIANTLWAGNLEIHVHASDWFKHKHQLDSNYDSVILHVVLHNDVQVTRTNGEVIPQIELAIPERLLEIYAQLMQNSQWIPCATKLKLVDAVIIQSWMQTMIAERLSAKENLIHSIQEANKTDWESSFYIVLARSFGFDTNSDAFELLAKSLPLKCLAKHKDKPFQLEALLFGQSGLLHLQQKAPDAYQLELLKEYNFLRVKYDLRPIDGKMWKMLRLRPPNFPYIRIAQFAALVHRSSKLFSQVIAAESVKELHKLFNCEPSEYWLTHYRFGEICPIKSKKIGKSALDILLINTVAPFLFAYGQSIADEAMQDKALALLESLPAEKNSVIEQWRLLGVKAISAFDSQALLQLKNKYCDDKKCLRCRIGHKVLTSV